MKLGWPQVVVIGIIVAGVVVLAVTGKDPTALIGLAVAILIGVGLIQQGEIKSSANGSMSRLITLMETMAEQLRQMPPALPAPPALDEAEKPPAGDRTG